MVHKHREILNNRNAIFSLCEAVKQAAKLSLNRMWRHFSLDDAYTKISGVFCPAPVYLTWVVGFVITPVTNCWHITSSENNDEFELKSSEKKLICFPTYTKAMEKISL